MFGFVLADAKSLSKEDKEIYRSYYCSLCRELGKHYGFLGKMTLNYDMTFLYIFLNSYFNEKEEQENFYCPIHPTKRKTALMSKYAYYCASMTILLTYHKFLDDCVDEKSIRANITLRLLKKAGEKAKTEFCNKSNVIEKSLARLHEIEKRGEHNPDIPGNCFGELMGELFDVDSNDEILYAFGYALGKAIYIMDACVDLKKDIKKQRYNPMVEISTKNFQEILTMLLSDCTHIYDTMDIEKNKSIIDNILYSGIWSAFNRRKNN